MNYEKVMGECVPGSLYRETEGEDLRAALLPEEIEARHRHTVEGDGTDRAAFEAGNRGQ